jgi:hypothetical protein
MRCFINLVSIVFSISLKKFSVFAKIERYIFAMDYKVLEGTQILGKS